MPKPLLALALLLALAPLTSAGPPERPSSRTERDEVWVGLRQFRAEKDWIKRAELIEELARTRDPRVAVVCGQALDARPPVPIFSSWPVAAGAKENGPLLNSYLASSLLERYYVPRDTKRAAERDRVRIWWKEHEADLRRRAEQLPR
jgi:hypothetical protein